MVDIFTYTDYRKFIYDFCNEVRETKPFFSYRYIAQKAELKSVGFISWVVKGKRNISPRLAHKIAAIFKLGKREADYFELIVNHNQSKTTDERQIYLNRMLAYRSSHATTVNRDRDQFYTQWYYSAIREMVSIAEIRNESQVADALNPSINQSEAKQALDLLTRLGMIHKNADGIYERVEAALTAGPTVDAAIIHGFQTATMQLAQSAIHRFAKEDRDISTVTLSCNSKDIARIRERIRQMRAEISEIACASKDADQTFQINTQFYPLTKRIARRGV